MPVSERCSVSSLLRLLEAFGDQVLSSSSRSPIVYGLLVVAAILTIAAARRWAAIEIGEVLVRVVVAETSASALGPHCVRRMVGGYVNEGITRQSTDCRTPRMHELPSPAALVGKTCGRTPKKDVET